MNYYSTHNPVHRVPFSEAVVNGLAPDGGLYMPEVIPSLPENFIASLSSISNEQIAFTIARPFIDENFPDRLLRSIIKDTINFEFPLVQLDDQTCSLELYHGPTLAFKDVGARFMALVLRQIANTIQQEITVLVATSGDTGSAVAHGFFQVEGIRVVILYPDGKVSALQEKQFATLGHNIHAVKVDGTFDDCQRLVKTAFLDAELRKQFFLSSANSINIARLLPQTFYYFFGWKQLQKKESVVFAVPSGNFGNLTAGIIAKKMGLPVKAFVAATNRNDVVPQYLHTGNFMPRPSVTTISNAMDVGNPSNFARMLALYEENWSLMTKDIYGYAFTDDETLQAIRQVYQSSSYTLDPHGAVAYLGLKKYQHEHPGTNGIIIETAHPSKFPDVVENALQQPLPLHPTLQGLQHQQVQSVTCSSSYDDFKNLLVVLK